MINSPVGEPTPQPPQHNEQMSRLGRIAGAIGGALVGATTLTYMHAMDHMISAGMNAPESTALNSLTPVQQVITTAVTTSLGAAAGYFGARSYQRRHQDGPSN